MIEITGALNIIISIAAVILLGVLATFLVVLNEYKKGLVMNERVDYKDD